MLFRSAAAEAADLAASAALCHGNLAWLAVSRNQLESARLSLDAAMRWAVLARERMVEQKDRIYEVQLLLIRAELHQSEFDDEGAGVALGQALALTLGMSEPRLAGSCRESSAQWALDRAEPALASQHAEALARLAAEFGLAVHAATAQRLRAQCQLLLHDWDAAAQSAAAAVATYRAVRATHLVAACLDVEADALWRGGHLSQAAQAFSDVAAVWAEVGQDANALAARLRAADAAAGVPDQADAALQAVRADLQALVQADGAADGLAGAKFGLAARVAAWRVLQRAGDPAAAAQLALATADLDRRLARFAAAELRERVRSAIPCHRDVVEALATVQSQTADRVP